MSDRLVLERPTDSIRVGYRLRKDLGNLEELVDSIRRMGILEPLVITPDGTLVCGARRLAAARIAELRFVKVTVNARISTQLEELLAELHENTLQKPYAARELAALYAELKTVETEEAARRDALTRFGAPETEARDGDGDSPPPKRGTAREFAAHALTGTDSYQTHERVLMLERLARDMSRPDWLRSEAQTALDGLDGGEKVNAHYQHVYALELTEQLDRAAEDNTLSPQSRQNAGIAADRVRQEPSARTRIRLAQQAVREAHRPPIAAEQSGTGWADLDDRMRARLVGRRFVEELDRATAWWEPFDPDLLGPTLSDRDWGVLNRWAESLAHFLETAARSRAGDAADTAGAAGAAGAVPTVGARDEPTG